VIAIALALLATANTIVVSDGDEVVVPVPVSGLTLRLPDAVRVVTPSTTVEVRPILAPRAAPTQGAPSAQQPAPAQDVRVFQVRPLRPGAEQSVTFLLADDRALSVRIVPAAPGNEDTFVDLRWAKKALGQGRTAAGDPFLSAERALLMAMLRDEHAFGWQALRKRIDLPEYPQLEFNLVRTYETDNLVGAIYTVTNRSAATVYLNQTVLALGRPNQAVLVQMDHSELRSCAEDNSAEPRGTGCLTAVRIVARSGSSPRALHVSPDAAAAMPFVREKAAGR
jgi:hypothetical protein